MVNQEKLATLGAGHTGRKQTKQKTQYLNLIDEQHGPYQTTEVNPGAREWQAVPASHKTPAMLLV